MLAPYNCCLLFSDNSQPNAGGSSTFVADGKWDLLTRAKIVLNIHQGDEPYFEWLRALDAIHAGAVVVTEHSGGIAPLVAGEHLLAAAPESLPFVLDAALRDPKAWRACGSPPTSGSARGCRWRCRSRCCGQPRSSSSAVRCRRAPPWGAG